MATIYIFHRDLRIIDNWGLNAAFNYGYPVIPIFVFTHTQIDTNPLKSYKSVQFMCESLKELSNDIKESGGKLRFFHDDTTKVLSEFVKTTEIAAIMDVADYTPFAKQRTQEIKSFCEKNDIFYGSIHDIYLTEPGTIRNKSSKTYQKFTPFYNAVKNTKIPKPYSEPVNWYKGGPAGKALTEIIADFEKSKTVAVKGGRSEALKLLKNITSKYEIIKQNTSMLSAHNHFGTVSIREVYAAANESPAFRRQLWWRDFYGHIMSDFENLYGVGPYEFQKIGTKWKLDERKTEIFKKWCKGTTGVELVDAAIKQLLETGYIPNRARLVAASWLTKTVKIHWRYGEQFFAKHLVDYDATLNMMNWIWVASVLPFASAPFRSIGAETTANKYNTKRLYRNKWLSKTVRKSH